MHLSTTFIRSDAKDSKIRKSTIDQTDHACIDSRLIQRASTEELTHEELMLK